MPNPGDIYNPWRRFVGCFVPNAITRRTDLSPTAKLIFGKLCQFAGQNGQAYPSYNTLAKEVGVERRQAIRGIKELVNFGLIRPEGKVKENGGYTSNVYFFLWHQIFFDDGHTDPGDKNDTRGGVTNVTTPRCQKRHHLVSDMSPKEIHTRESDSEKTTTEIMMLLSGTPLKKISEKELKILANRHGRDRVIQAADIAAEKSRRIRKEIKNPGGYLNTLCEDLVVPEWYEPPDVRQAKLEASTEGKRSEARKVAELLAKEERDAQKRDDYWRSLSEEEKQMYRDKTRESSPLLTDLNGAHLNAIAKLIAWDNCQQMNTIDSSTA